jgi:hypothetical protein
MKNQNKLGQHVVASASRHSTQTGRGTPCWNQNDRIDNRKMTWFKYHLTRLFQAFHKNPYFTAVLGFFGLINAISDSWHGAAALLGILI